MLIFARKETERNKNKTKQQPASWNSLTSTAFRSTPTSEISETETNGMENTWKRLLKLLNFRKQTIQSQITEIQG